MTAKSNRIRSALAFLRRWWAVALLLSLPLLNAIGMLAAIYVPVLLAKGIHVTIQNTDSQPLRSVVLHVTGESKHLGDVGPGGTAAATVHPTGESHLEIEFTDVDGQTNRLDAGGYFESGYRGTIGISIKDGVIQTNEQKIRLRWWLP